MTRLLVDVQLEVLVVVEEAAPDLVDGEVEGVLLVQQVGVVPVGQRGLHLNHLPGHLWEHIPVKNLRKEMAKILKVLFIDYNLFGFIWTLR